MSSKLPTQGTPSAVANSPRVWTRPALAPNEISCEWTLHQTSWFVWAVFNAISIQHQVAAFVARRLSWRCEQCAHRACQTSLEWTRRCSTAFPTCSAHPRGSLIVQVDCMG